MARLRTPRTRAHFVLQLGYFRVRQRFFRLDADVVSDDLDHVCRRYLDGATVTQLGVSKHTRQQHTAWILERFGYRARIIGANEHESHYVFDVLFNNLTDIQPEFVLAGLCRLATPAPQRP